jgi:hypothetical protein
MTALAILRKASSYGLKLRAENGKLYGKGVEPTPELRAEIAEHQLQLIQLLTPSPRSFKQQSEEFLREVRRFWPGTKGNKVANSAQNTPL